jgi:hypothetical protein
MGKHREEDGREKERAIGDRDRNDCDAGSALEPEQVFLKGASASAGPEEKRTI